MRLYDLAKFIDEKERELAYGSETALLPLFVDKCGYVGDILAGDYDTQISDEAYQSWVDAYARYERMISDGIEFDVNDLF